MKKNFDEIRESKGMGFLLPEESTEKVAILIFLAILFALNLTGFLEGFYFENEYSIFALIGSIFLILFFILQLFKRDYVIFHDESKELRYYLKFISFFKLKCSISILDTESLEIHFLEENGGEEGNSQSFFLLSNVNNTYKLLFRHSNFDTVFWFAQKVSLLINQKIEVFEKLKNLVELDLPLENKLYHLDW